MQTLQSLCRFSVPKITDIDQYLLKVFANIAGVRNFLNHSVVQHFEWKQFNFVHVCVLRRRPMSHAIPGPALVFNATGTNGKCGQHTFWPISLKVEMLFLKITNLTLFVVVWNNRNYCLLYTFTNSINNATMNRLTSTWYTAEHHACKHRQSARFSKMQQTWAV